MVDNLRLNQGESVIEFGPGTGPFTAEICRNLPHPSCYMGIERDRLFVDLLRSRFPDLNFICGSAANAFDMHNASGLGPVRAIISGLPFASLPHGVQDGIIASVERLMSPGCIFRTFQYVHAYALPTASRFRRRVDGLLGSHRRSPVIFRNLPPSFVLTWQR